MFVITSKSLATHIHIYLGLLVRTGGGDLTGGLSLFDTGMNISAGGLTVRVMSIHVHIHVYMAISFVI